MKNCSKCHKPTDTFPLSKRGKPSRMCQPCYDWQKIWNADKHKATMALVDSAPAGFRFCTTCRKNKPEDDFKTNPKQRRKIERGQHFAKHCAPCRDKLAKRVNERRHTAEMDPAVKAVNLADKRDYSRKFRIKLLSAYGPICRCCGETIVEFLEIHHVNEDGAAHRRQIGRGPESLYRWAERNGFPDALTVICANCHNAETFYGGCPHKQINAPHLVEATA
jgi:hypothetical protein